MDSKERKAKALLTINKRDLDTELAKQGNRVGTIGGKVEDMEFEVREEQEKLDIIYSDLFIKFSEKYEQEDKKVTKDYIVGRIRKHSTYKAQRKKVSETKRKLGRWKSYYKGIIHKTDMLKEYCYNDRKRLEQGNDRIKAKAVNRINREK